MNRVRSLERTAGILAFTVILLLAALPVMAQTSDPTIKTASLRLWPEYDDPGLLVIFAGEFSSAAGFPRDVSFQLPDGARNVQAAYPAATGGLLIAQSETVGGQLTFKQLSTPAFHIEYYLDRQPSGNQRVIDHVFQAPFAIETLEVTVQQPARSADFSVSPAAESSYIGQDGLTYYVFSRANLAAGDRLDITLRYTKSDSGVSNPQLAVTNASPPPAPTAAPGGSSATHRADTWLPLALIGLGVAVLTVSVTYWLLYRRRQPVASAASRKSALPTRAQRTTGPSTTGAADFCTQCGHRHRPDDRFCAQCGAPRRG